MRRYIAFLLALFLFLPFQPISRAEPAEYGFPAVSDAQAAALVEVSTGRVLWSKNGQASLPMASTTKIMTAIVAIENASLTDIVTVSLAAKGTEGSSMYLEVGERQTVESLLYGLMLRSGNDAAVALAEHIGGSVEGFAVLMNQTAERLGLSGSHFVNPHGLHSSDHYTTAEDLGRLSAYALNNPDFARIVGTKRISVPWDGHDWDRAMANKNKLLYDYSGATGVKTGYTKAAGRCLVSSASRDGLELVAVVLNCGPMYERCAELMNWGFQYVTLSSVCVEGEAFGQVAVSGGKPTHTQALASRTLTLPLLPNDRPAITANFYTTLSAPLAASSSVGELIFSLPGMSPVSVTLVSSAAISDTRYPAQLRRILQNWPLVR